MNQANHDSCNFLFPFFEKLIKLIFEFMSFLWFIIIGIVAGWAAGTVMRGGGFGLIVNFLIGIVGSLLGGWLFSLIGLQSTGGIIANLIVAFIGAIVLLWIISLFQRKPRSN